MLFKYKRIVFFFLCVLQLIYLSACSYKQQQLLFEKKMHNADSLQRAELSPAPNYSIQVQDILEIKNLQNIEYIASEQGKTNANLYNQGMNYQVENDGTIALPIIGRIPIAGLTRIEASRKIEQLYQKELLKNPIIDVKLVNLKVTVLGEVNKQGNYALSKDKTGLIEILGEAGGLTEKANETHIKIIRGKDDQKETILINLRDLSILTNPAITLQNNDIVYVAQNKRAVRTEKLQGLSAIMQPVLIIINTALIIYTLTR
jgi:polysaccharide export outer membrane protein